MPEDRRHIAILFSDIVGYTSLMGEDESKALDMLSRNRTIHETHIKQFNGTLIKDIGDAILASFSLASDAVRCAIEIQKSCKEDSIPLKIGVHEGEVVFKDSDVFGDGVNIASRLQSDTQEGCISISGSVYRDVKNKADIQTKYIGEKTFKNVDEPIRVYKILCGDEPSEPSTSNSNELKKSSRKPYYLLAGLIVLVIAVLLVWKSKPSKEVVELEKSIAVLPFKNLSINQEDQYLADGMMDAILTHLQRIEDLSVRSRTSTEQYRDPDKNVTDIGKALSANYILEGSFQKIGNKANLTVQLIIAETDEHIWAEDYNRDWSDVFNIQKEIAERIAKELYANISNEARAGIDKIPTNNMVAYDLFLKGDQSYWNSWSDKNGKSKIEESILYFDKAIELDDNFSFAYTGLGRSYWLLAGYSRQSNLYEKAKKNLEKAIELDEYNGWAYAELAVVSDIWDWDSAAAKINLDMAMLLQPNDGNVYIHYFFHEMRLGNCTKLKWIREHMMDIFPNANHQFNMFNLALLYCQQDYSGIEKLFDKYWEEVIEIENENIQRWRGSILYNSFVELKDIEKGKMVLRRIQNDLNRNQDFQEAILLACVGENELALKQIRKLENEQNSHFKLASLYASINDNDKMYSHLDS
ncbi:MAG: hypothetical protein KAQ62_27615, partial [Cyclobacteriaceae bacterium]|nr:hypothetical protein [Cyclobacteriaceae bacterium]